MNFNKIALKKIGSNLSNNEKSKFYNELKLIEEVLINNNSLTKNYSNSNLVNFENENIIVKGKLIDYVLNI